jgi:hypothetical protein
MQILLVDDMLFLPVHIFVTEQCMILQFIIIFGKSFFVVHNDMQCDLSSSAPSVQSGFKGCIFRSVLYKS